MYRCGRDSFQWRRNSVSARHPLEGPYGLMMLPLQDTDVLHLKLFSQDFIILNSNEAICELLEKRSNIYSDRVGCPMKSLTYPR